MRWGICGAGCIAEDFCSALRCLGPSEHEVIAVVSDNVSNARDFSIKFNIPNIYRGWEEFAEDKRIDIVYISTPLYNRFDHSSLMMKYNKHVLCQAPCSMSGDEVNVLINLAKAKEVFFMEGIWMCFLPIYTKIKEEIERGSIGEIKHLDAAIFFDILHKESKSTTGKSGGSVSNTGAYLLWLAYFIFRENPEHILTAGDFSPKGVDEACNIILVYRDGSRASLSCHTKLRGRTDAWIYGTTGNIYIHPPFWSTNKITVNDVETEIPFAESNRPDIEFNYPKSIGFTSEAELVRIWVNEGFTESPLYTLSQTLEVSRLIENVRDKLYKSRMELQNVQEEEHPSFFGRLGCTLV